MALEHVSLVLSQDCLLFFVGSVVVVAFNLKEDFGDAGCVVVHRSDVLWPGHFVSGTCD